MDNLGKSAFLEGRYVDGADYWAEALNRIVDSGDEPLFALYLEELGRIAAAPEQPHRTAGLFGEAEGLRETIGAPLPADEWIEYEP